MPFLTGISVPSPIPGAQNGGYWRGTLFSSATITYDTAQGAVTKITDSNGNTTSLRPIVNQGGVLIGGEATVAYPSMELAVEDYTTTWNSQMSEVTRTFPVTTFVGGQAQPTFTPASLTYGSANDPFSASGVTDQNKKTWTYAWDTFGNLQTATSPKITHTTYSWSYTDFALGELQTVQESSTTGGTKTATTFKYNEPSGSIQEVDSPLPDHTGDGLTVKTNFTYTPGLHNLSTVTIPNNNNSSRTVTFGYTADGSYNQAEAMDQPITFTNENGHVWHFRYDPRCNTTSETDPLANQTTFAYDIANEPTDTTYPVTSPDPYGRQVQTVYEYLGGPVTQVMEYDGAGALYDTNVFQYGNEGELASESGRMDTVSYSYDPAFRPIFVNDGDSNQASYGFDLAGRPTFSSYPGVGTTYYNRFDGAGNLLQRTDGKQQITNYVYGDTDGLLTAVQYQSQPTQNVSLAYDLYDRLTSSTDAPGSESWTYDDLDEPQIATRTFAAFSSNPISTTYKHYSDGSRSSMSNPGGSWSYLYDGAGNQTGMTAPTGTSAWHYQSNDWLASKTNSLGRLTSTFQYAAAGDLTSLNNRSSSYTGISVFSNFSYDAVLNLSAMQSSVRFATSLGGAYNYTYPASPSSTAGLRLGSETSPATGNVLQSFAYDGAGNPTQFANVSGIPYTHIQRTGTGYSYDSNGAATSYSGISHAWDQENRMTSWGSTATFGYGADGSRAWKQTSAGTTYYVYDGDDPVLELNSSGSVSAVNVFGADGLVARESGMTQPLGTSGSTTTLDGLGSNAQTGGTYTSYLFDPRGNVAECVSASGFPTTSEAFSAYGSMTFSGFTPTDPWGYGGQWGYYRDNESSDYLCGMALLRRQHRSLDEPRPNWTRRRRERV